MSTSLRRDPGFDSSSGPWSEPASGVPARPSGKLAADARTTAPAEPLEGNADCEATTLVPIRSAPLTRLIVAGVAGGAVVVGGGAVVVVELVVVSSRP